MQAVIYGRSRSYREMNQHPSLPWNFITHAFLDPYAFPDNAMQKTIPGKSLNGSCKSGLTPPIFSENQARSVPGKKTGPFRADGLKSSLGKGIREQKRHISEPLVWGHQKGVTPICSDFPVFFRFVPICVPCFLEYLDFSDLFRFPQNKSEQIRETPHSADAFCRTPNIEL